MSRRTGVSADIERPTWSKSQIAALRECRRRFLLLTASDVSSGPLAQVPSLKKVKNRHLWSGSIVHEAIGDILKTVRQAEAIPEESTAIAKIHDRMRSEFKASREGRADAPLFEHRFNTPVAPEVWRRQWENVERSVRWFIGSNWLKRLASLGPECWKAVDEVLSFDVNGIKAYAKIDCAVETGGKFYLIDWRTSAPGPREEPSLLVAALYAHENWGADPEAIEALAVSVHDGSTFHANVSEESLMETHLRIEEEAAELQQATSVVDDPMQVSPPSDIAVCRRCSFQALCYPAGVLT